jgi:23S rRNA maturation mini-RNase III
MAYLWSDKITDYYYSNPELDTVAVMWTDPDDKLTREHYIKVDESDEQWRDFVAEVPYEKIDERTMVRHEQFREQFREAFRNYAQTHDVNQNVDQTKPANFEDTIINFINDFDVTNAEHKETLFKLKLKVFEQDIVKNSKSADKFKNAKTFIRKSESPMDVLLGYMVFANGAELKMAPTEKFEVLGVYVPIKILWSLMC